jgi:hypothetical protein
MSIYADQFDILVTTTLDKVRPILRDQISNENALTAWLNMKSRVNVDGGTVIRRPLLTAFNDTVSTYSGYDVIDTTPQEGLGWAEFEWKQHAGSVTISGEEVKKNAGAAQLISLLQAKVDQLKLSIADDLNAMLWAASVGNGGKDFNGIPVIVKNATSFAGIDPATYAWWKSTLSTTVDLTTFDGVQALNNLFNTVRLTVRRWTWSSRPRPCSRRTRHWRFRTSGSSRSRRRTWGSRPSRTRRPRSSWTWTAPRRPCTC